jgi:hypothetical protein
MVYLLVPLGGGRGEKRDRLLLLLHLVRVLGRYNPVSQPHLAATRKDCSGRRPPYNRYGGAWAWRGQARNELGVISSVLVYGSLGSGVAVAVADLGF